ncbi:MAG TPA: CsgG/HfaB family protein [Gemmatimonadaceae bacterium]|jgi:tetratricopeptide (TPR) repeat protein
MQTLTTYVGFAALIGAGACAPAISGSADNVSRLEHAVAIDPNAQGAHRSLGIAYFRAGQFDHAHVALTDAVRMDPRDGVAALYLGLTDEQTGDIAGARTAYETYLRVGQSRGAKNQIRDRLELLRLRQVQLQAKQALADEGARAAVAGPKNTVAVMPFVFSGADTSLKPLERGFAELVTTDLSQSAQLTVLERERMQAVLDEIALQHENSVAEGSGVRAGKILRVGRMVGGTIEQTANGLRADAVVTDLATTEVGRPASDQETLDQIFALEKNVVLQLFANLGVQLTTAERNAIEQRPTRSLAAFLAFSRGLELEDRGQLDQANRLFDNASRIDPGFAAAQQKARESRSATAGAQVSAATVESRLRGTAEGALVSAATSNVDVITTSATLASVADGLNPSVAGGATSGAAGASSQPAKDPSSATGADNVSSKTAKVTITVHKP